MRADEFITEAPLPPDWDKEVYKPQTSFAKRLRYATEKAKKLGTGSSRVAFEIEHEGRATVLKIAKNKKGLAQNEYESQILNDYYVRPLNITIPIIDFDEEHNQPLWIHTEKATKVKPTEFKKYFNGMSPDELIHFARWFKGEQQVSAEVEEKYQAIHEEDGPACSFADLVANFDTAIADFGRLANWGIYKGTVVIIDIGGSSDIITSMY